MPTMRMFDVTSNEFMFPEHANLQVKIVHDSGTLKYNMFINIY
jgi:hypothetical protein